MSQSTVSPVSQHSREIIDDPIDKLTEIAHTMPELVDANPVIRFSGLPASRDTVYEVDVAYRKKDDIFFAGSVSLPSDDGRFINDRLMTKTPFKTRDAFNAIPEVTAHARFDGGRWHFEAGAAESCLQHFLDCGHDVAGHLQTFLEHIDIPPAETAAEPAANHAGGGAMTPYVETGACPASGCEYHSDEFKQLRGHIGGKVAGGDDSHKHLKVRIDDYR